MFYFGEIMSQRQSLGLLDPIIEACKKLPNSSSVDLLNALEREDVRLGLAELIDLALAYVANVETIFSRVHEIRGSSDPNGTIEDMLAELTAAKYLVHKGFKNIVYVRKNGVDFCCEFDGKIIHVEVAYVRGPNFKTQIKLPFDKTLPSYQLDSRKLINRLKTVAGEKEQQILKHGYNRSNALVLIVSYLLELYEPWLDHEQVNSKHPVQFFVESRKIPTIILGPGTLYEPDDNVLDGVFGKLKPFNGREFYNLDEYMQI
jgi:hypothetical protein